MQFCRPAPARDSLTGLFDWFAAFGYLFEVVITSYVLYLLLLFNGSDNPPNAEHRSENPLMRGDN